MDVLQDLREFGIRLGVVVYCYSLSTEASRSELEAYIVKSRSSITIMWDIVSNNLTKSKGRTQQVKAITVQI